MSILPKEILYISFFLIDFGENPYGVCVFFLFHIGLYIGCDIYIDRGEGLGEMDKLQWGSRKRLRCVKMKESSSSSSIMTEAKSDVIVKKKITSRVDRRVVAPADNVAALDSKRTILNQKAQALCAPVQSPSRCNR